MVFAMWLGSNYTKGKTMRIPLSRADWPTAFNKTAKYVGRHWPLGKLPLSTARETTAILFGYNSVHDAQQEILPAIAPRQISVQAIVRSMTLRALVRFGCRPEQVSTMFRKIPWRDLSVWEITEEAIAQERFSNASEEAKRFGKILVHDEFGYYSQHKSPAEFIHLYDEKAIPAYSYAVSNSGLIYRSSYMEGLMGDAPSVSELTDLEIDCSTHDFIKKYMLPLIWKPIVEFIDEVKDDQWDWYAPYMIRVEKLIDDRYALFHKGNNAYYPGAYSAEEVKKAFVAIYLNKTVQATDLTGVEVGCTEKCDYLSGDYRKYIISGTGSSLSAGKQIFINNQLFLRVTPIEGYQSDLESKWINTWEWPPITNQELVIPEKVLTKGIEEEHIKIGSWFDAARSYYSDILDRANVDIVAEALASFFKDNREDLASLKAMGFFNVDVEEGMTKEQIAEIELENQREAEEARHYGVSVSKFHPELVPYFDDIALGFYYKDYLGCRYYSGCYSHDWTFIADLIRQRIEPETSSEKDTPLALAIIADIANQKLNIDEFENAWVAGRKLHDKYRRQNDAIMKMREYALHLLSADPAYASHGPLAEVTRESITDIYSKLSTIGRKFNMTAAVQTTEELSGYYSAPEKPKAEGLMRKLLDKIIK